MRISGNTRAIGYGFVLGMVAIGFLILYMGTTPDYINPKVVPELEEPYAATCKITSGKGSTSTGVLLNTGFVLSTAHGIDSNHNWKVDPGERKVRLKFELRRGFVEVDGWVITAENDYSIIQLDSLVRSDISVTKEKLRIGDPVYTFGYPLGRGIHLTKGYQSSKAKVGGNERTSISAYMGNSGGGVFTKEGRLVGVLRSVGVDYETIHVDTRVIIPSARGLLVIKAHGHGRSMHVLSSWSQYMHIRDIYSSLMSKNLGHVLIPEQIEVPFDPDNIITITVAQIWIVLMFVAWFRNELFK